LIEHLLANTLSGVRKFVSEKPEENLHLEFKKKSEPTREEWGKDDLKNFGEILSGFSNAEGGILIWGIHTEKVDSVDVAIEVRPMANLSALHGKLKSLISSNLSPQNEFITSLAFLTLRKVTRVISLFAFRRATDDHIFPMQQILGGTTGKRLIQSEAWITMKLKTCFDPNSIRF
jgi:hypothetical protein